MDLARFRHGLRLGVVLLGLAVLPPTITADPPEKSGADSPRPLLLEENGAWIGNGIAYGPHRDGQRPGGEAPTREQLREDLEILSRHWSLLRLYSSSDGPAADLLDLIRENRIPMRVMLGAWIAVEETRDSTGAVLESFPDARAANLREVEAAIRLAGEYEDIVAAVSVGNETQVFWSGHRSPPDILVGHVRAVREGVSQPVTVADDFNFWNKPESRRVAREIDFLTLHAHPLWNGLQLVDALSWQQEVYEDIVAHHPDRSVVIGETGWATRRHDEGEQATLMKGRLGEEEQAFFHRAVTAWAEENRIPLFFFEAFDENWMGGIHPDEVEKHWGLYRADRTPKAVFAGEEGP